MIRRLNYTDRRRILREDVRIVLREIGGKTSFSADVDLRRYELPGDAQVFVEAYRETIWMRFPLGTVAARRLPGPEESQLSEFDSPEGLLFRVRVTSAGDRGQRHGLLLAEADQIPLRKPDEADDLRIPLLPVVPDDLGDELWQLRIDGRALLYVNRALDYQQLAWSPAFFALVYPAVVREVLTRILLLEEPPDPEDTGDWRVQWLRFAMQLHGIGEPPTGDDAEAKERWIAEVVATFARQHGLLARFCAAKDKEEAL